MKLSDVSYFNMDDRLIVSFLFGMSVSFFVAIAGGLIGAFPGPSIVPLGMGGGAFVASFMFFPWRIDDKPVQGFIKCINQDYNESIEGPHPPS